MPANLTQQYHKAEQAYRSAQTPEEELEALQLMLRELPKHKGTDKLQADLKQKISRTKKQLGGSNRTARRGGFRLPHQGAGRAVLVGGPNAGKSRLLAALTRAEPEVAPYPFTTTRPQPGMMPWEDVTVQLVDTPPITADFFDADTQALIRGADLVLLLLDLGNDEGVEQCQEAYETIQGSKSRVACASRLDESDIGVAYTQAILVANKIDDPASADRFELFREFCPLELESYQVSAETGAGLAVLREAVYRAMDVVRVYTKHPSRKEPDIDKPFTIRRGGTLLDIAEMIHKDLATNLKNARVWGSEVHDGTVVKGDYVLHDKDIVELHV